MREAKIGARLEIEQLLARCCHSFDDRDWTVYRSLFAPEASLDFSELDGPVGRIDEGLAFLKVHFPAQLRTQHAISSMLVDIMGDRATARTVCRALAVDIAAEPASATLIALRYDDVLCVTADGWRIEKRVGRKFGIFAMPVLAPPTKN